MRLDLVMEEVAQAIRSVTDLRQVFAYPPDDITAPAAVVTYPTAINFDQAYQRGEDQISGLEIHVLVGRVTERSARDTIGAWASGSGPRSLKAALEAYAWTTCDDLTVTTCEFDTVRVAGVDYLAAIFTSDIVGPGEDN